MKIVKKVVKEVEEIAEIHCDKCGKSCKGKLGNLNGLIEANAYGHCDAEYLEDGNVYCFSLCEKCVIDLFKSFKHQPSIHNNYLPESWGD